MSIELLVTKDELQEIEDVGIDFYMSWEEKEEEKTGEMFWIEIEACDYLKAMAIVKGESYYDS